MKLLILILFAFVSLQAEDFKKTKLMRQNDKGKTQQVAIKLHIGDESIQIQGKKIEPMTFDFGSIKSVEYERSTHPRWKTAVFLTPLALLSKSKHHWLNIQAEDGQFAILRLDKSEQQMIRAVVEAKWGHEVKELLPE